MTDGARQELMRVRDKTTYTTWRNDLTPELVYRLEGRWGALMERLWYELSEPTNAGQSRRAAGRRE